VHSTRSTRKEEEKEWKARTVAVSIPNSEWARRHTNGWGECYTSPFHRRSSTIIIPDLMACLISYLDQIHLRPAESQRRAPVLPQYGECLLSSHLLSSSCQTFLFFFFLQQTQTFSLKKKKPGNLLFVYVTHTHTLLKCFTRWTLYFSRALYSSRRPPGGSRTGGSSQFTTETLILAC
jgi:hypothetical protein